MHRFRVIGMLLFEARLYSMRGQFRLARKVIRDLHETVANLQAGDFCTGIELGAQTDHFEDAPAFELFLYFTDPEHPERDIYTVALVRFDWEHLVKVTLKPRATKDGHLGSHWRLNEGQEKYVTQELLHTLLQEV